jgi:hypothetical protein
MLHLAAWRFGHYASLQSFSASRSDFHSRKIPHTRNHIPYRLFNSSGSGLHFISAPPFSKTALFHPLDSRTALDNLSGVSRLSLACTRYASGLGRRIWRKSGRAGRGIFDLFDLSFRANVKRKSSKNFTGQMLAGFFSWKRLFIDCVSTFDKSLRFYFPPLTRRLTAAKSSAEMSRNPNP